MENKKLPQLCADKDCTGCLACVNSCRQGALSIGKNEEGFYRPRFDADKCVGCGLCERNCPVINRLPMVEAGNLKVFAGWHLDEEIRMKSSSGGAFTALAENIILQGGVVYGAAYTEDMQIAHIEVKSVSELERLRLSKYAQSCVELTMKDVKEHLEMGKKVMYVGTPCQVAGLKSFLRKDYNNLLAVDIICHGVPSMMFLQKYLGWLGEKIGKVKHINFRDKRKGWYDALRVVKTDSGREKVLRGEADNYWVGFNNNNNLQYCCYNCQFQGFPRVSDMTIADFWGIGKTKAFGHKDEIEKGVSLVVVNNQEKQHYLDECRSRMFIEPRSLEEAIVGNNTALVKSVCPASRDSIYVDLQLMDYDSFRKRYLSTTRKQDVVKLFREYIPYGIVKFLRMRSQK